MARTSPGFGALCRAAPVARQSRCPQGWPRPRHTREAIRPVQELAAYRPYFDLHRWAPHDSGAAASPQECGYYGIGRISRDDGAKYPSDLWRTFSRVAAPGPVKCFVLGWGDQAFRKCGHPRGHRGLDWMLWAPGAVPAQELYRRVHTMVHQTGGSRENWPRVAFEAWASGVAVIAERDYAWPELVADGETGLLCGSSDEFVEQTSALAHDESRRLAIVQAARGRMQAEHCNVERSFVAWSHLV